MASYDCPHMACLNEYVKTHLRTLEAHILYINCHFFMLDLVHTQGFWRKTLSDTTHVPHVIRRICFMLNQLYTYIREYYTIKTLVKIAESISMHMWGRTAPVVIVPEAWNFVFKCY